MQRRVLFVSDNADLCAVASRLLEREGYEIRTASHSGHAILAALETPVDVLVAELAAADVSGPALAERLRRQHPRLRTVFMANPGTPEGVDAVVVRPFTGDDLLERIESALCATSR